MSGPTESYLHFLLGLQRGYETDGERMLRCVLDRYDIWGDLYDIAYCYTESPPSTQKQRRGMIEEARRSVEAAWHDRPGVIVGLGWMACEVLTGRGKTRLKDTAGTKWRYITDRMDQAVWITYDPAACLFDPGVIVDISAVAVAAAREIGLECHVMEDDSLTKMERIWRRYL